MFLHPNSKLNFRPVEHKPVSLTTALLSSSVYNIGLHHGKDIYNIIYVHVYVGKYTGNVVYGETILTKHSVLGSFCV